MKARMTSMRSSWDVRRPAYRPSARALCIQIETFVILVRAALCSEGKRIHFVKIECFLHRMDALPSRFALAEHDNIDSIDRTPLWTGKTNKNPYGSFLSIAGMNANEASDDQVRVQMVDHRHLFMNKPPQ